MIYLPDNLTDAEEKKWIEHMKNRFKKSDMRNKLNSDTKLQIRSEEINKKYFDNVLDFNLPINSKKPFFSS